MTTVADPHGRTPRASAGRPLGEAKRAMILLHGRGDSAEGILGLAAAIPHPNFAFVAPQAAGYTWYPGRFLVPVAENEPFLSSALRRIGTELERLEAAGIGAQQTILLGFSQGACLAAEYAARSGRRLGGVVALSGALIGAPGEGRQDGGSLAGTPVFLGCSDRDPHIPRERVEASAEILRGLEAEVTCVIYPGLGHAVNEEELDWVRSLMSRPAEPARRAGS